MLAAPCVTPSELSVRNVLRAPSGYRWAFLERETAPPSTLLPQVCSSATLIGTETHLSAQTALLQNSNHSMLPNQTCPCAYPIGLYLRQS